MAGHSKWANIKHRKAAQDAKRGKVFTKHIREITVAAKMGGGLVEDNPRLRIAVDKALAANMTRDTIERAIKRGSGADYTENMEEVVYEGYGPSGVAVLVYTLTENKNRTVAEVRHAFSKSGGNLGTDGSVSYLFSKKGEIYLANDPEDSSEQVFLVEDDILEVALEAGAEDVVSHADGSFEVVTTPEGFLAVKEALTQAQFPIVMADVVMSAATQVNLDGESAEKVIRLLDHLEELDDVQNVYSNAELS